MAKSSTTTAKRPPAKADVKGAADRAEERSERQQVANRSQAQVPATPSRSSAGDSRSMPSTSLQDRMARSSSKGRSSSQKDNLVPLIYVLQAQSPQALKRNPAYIEGAEAGSIWLRNAANPIVPGEEGIIFQPCYFDKDVVEWIPRDDGGGFVARHRFKPEDEEDIALLAERLGAEAIEDEDNPNRVVYKTKNGHELIETRYHIGYVYGRGNPMPYVLPLTSTGHTFSKAFMFMMNSKTMDNGVVPPSYGCFYRLFTKFKQNTKGEWFGWDVEDAGWVTKEEDFIRGEALHDAFVSGEKDIEEPEADVRAPRSRADANEEM